MRYTAIYPLLSALLMSASAMAHTFSTAYLEVFVYQQQPAMLWKVALHDLARAGLLPGQNDEQISWQHVGLCPHRRPWLCSQGQRYCDRQHP